MSQLHQHSPGEFAEALLGLKGAEALHCAQACLESGGMAHLLDLLAQPAMEEVGDRWHTGRINVAQANAAFGLLRELLFLMVPDVPAFAAEGPLAVLACVEGERHELGVRSLGHLLTLDGWRVAFLGSDTPAADLAELVVAEPPVFVGLSVTLREHLPSTWYTIAHLRHVAPGPRILVGGRAAPALAHVEGPVSPDCIARSARQALALVRTWAIHPDAPCIPP